MWDCLGTFSLPYGLACLDSEWFASLYRNNAICIISAKVFKTILEDFMTVCTCMLGSQAMNPKIPI